MSGNVRKVSARLGFTGPMDCKPKYHANDTSLDVLNIVQEQVPIEDIRSWDAAPSLDVEGFHLYPHKSVVTDFTRVEEVERLHGEEIRDLLLAVCGADQVQVTGRPILRFGEKSQSSGALDNSRPARLVHIDVSDATAQGFYERFQAQQPRKVRRFVQFNVWRALSVPPQDVPLAVCDARTVSPEDLLPADAMFDRNGEIVFSFEGLVIRHNPKQRWAYYSNMRSDEALVFKTNDSDRRYAHFVPHGAFDDPSCPPDAAPRCSVEMRGLAVWYA